MFAARYFPDRYFARRYFPAVGASAAVVTARQYQRLLNGTAETISVKERLKFLRKIEDSQTPVLFIDRQGVRHLVHISRVTLIRLPGQMDDLDELNVQVVCVDAGEGRFKRTPIDVSVAVGVTTAQLTTTGGGLLLQDLTPLLLEDGTDLLLDVAGTMILEDDTDLVYEDSAAFDMESQYP